MNWRYIRGRLSIVRGFFFLSYRQRLSRYRRRILTRTLFRTEKGLIETLAQERGEIIAELDAMRKQYAEALQAEDAVAQALG